MNRRGLSKESDEEEVSSASERWMDSAAAAAVEGGAGEVISRRPERKRNCGWLEGLHLQKSEILRLNNCLVCLAED